MTKPQAHFFQRQGSCSLIIPRCQECAELFVRRPNKGSQVYCSRACANRARAKQEKRDYTFPPPRPEEVITAPCLRCGEAFTTTKSVRICPACKGSHIYQGLLRCYALSALTGEEESF